MPDDTQPGGQAPAGAQGQAPNAANPTQTPNASDPNRQQPNAQQPQAGSSDGNGQPDSDPNGQPSSASGDSDLAKRLERMEKELAETRKEAAGYRTKAKELDKLREDAENAKLGDVEKAQKAAEAAQKRLASAQTRIAASELKLAAKEAGIIDPDDAIAHLAGKLDFDDEGEPKNVAELVAGLKAGKPHLFAKANGASGAASNGAGQQASNPNAGGATNPTRTGGPLTITPDQYLSREFQAEFRKTHGMDVFTAMRQGKVTVV